MYPLNMTKAAVGNVPAGFAVANDADEHASLSEHGYEPNLTDERAATMAALDAAGVKYDKRLSVDKLKALLPG